MTIHKLYIDWSRNKPRKIARCDDEHIGDRKNSNQWMPVTCEKCLKYVPEVLRQMGVSE